MEWELLCWGCYAVFCPGWHLHGALIETTWSQERTWVWFRVQKTPLPLLEKWVPIGRKAVKKNKGPQKSQHRTVSTWLSSATWFCWLWNHSEFIHLASAGAQVILACEERKTLYTRTPGGGRFMSLAPSFLLSFLLCVRYLSLCWGCKGGQKKALFRASAEIVKLLRQRTAQL